MIDGMKKLLLTLCLLFATSLHSAEVPADHDFSYAAQVKSVYDGDTYTVDIYLGLDVWLHGQKIRLLGYNTPEVRGASREAGLAARDYVRALIDGKEVILRTPKDGKGKYGRWLAEVYFKSDGQLVSIGDLLRESGHAKRVDY